MKNLFKIIKIIAQNSTAHRSKSFPKGPRGMSSKSSTKRDDTASPLSDTEGGLIARDTNSRNSNFSSYADYTSRDVSEEIDDDEPPLSERVATSYRDDEVRERMKIMQQFFT
jgi:hypothetical protein